MDVYFESAHYTRFSNEYNYLHGHTYRVDVEYEAKLGDEGYLLDFERLNSLVQGIARQWNYKLLVPEDDVKSIDIKGPFKVEVKIVKGRYATAEVICQQMLKEIRNGIGNSDGKLSLTIWEGPRYAAQCSE